MNNADTPLGFIGLGVMGEPMCSNLVRKSERRVFINDIHAEPVERVASVGGLACGSIAEVAQAAEIVFLSLPSIVQVWETLWHYMQGGPGVFKGDLHFYTADGDIRARVAQIDTSQCPLWLLTGEYDYSCTPQDTEFLARSICGSHWEIMKGMGHFPMSEDPERFLNYLRPVLAQAAAC